MGEMVVEVEVTEVVEMVEIVEEGREEYRLEAD